MSDVVLKNDNYPIDLTAGDTYVLRFNLKDSDGTVIPVDTDTVIKFGIKEYISSDTFVIPEKTATTYTYDENNQTYTVEYIFTSDDTLDILYFNDKVRSHLKCVYDIEMHRTHFADNSRFTVLHGELKIKRSIAGAV